MTRTFGGKNGNIVAMLMGTVAMVGIVGVSAMNMIGGPITTAAKVTHQNMAQNDLLMNAKVVVMNASTRPNMGDEDGDGYIEPVPFVPASDSVCGITLPTGGEGGCLPADIGAILTDPWGTSYAYCVWDHGDPASSPNRIDGEDSTSGAVLAIISAGPNKRFETPCRPYDGDPDTNDIAINPAGDGDDLVQIYTYAAAVAGSGGLWELKQNEPETAVIDKKLEIGDVAAGTGFAFDTQTGTGEFPYVKTDFLASKSGGNTPVTMIHNIALDGNWLSGDGGNQGVFVDENGRVGIGTSTPARPLDIHGLGQITLSNSNSAGSYITGVSLLTARPDITKTIEASATGSGNKGWMMAAEAEDAPSAQASNLRFMYFDGIGWKSVIHVRPNGNVGIGTSTPKALLHLQGGNRTTTDGMNGVIAENPDNGTLGTRAILRTDGGIALMRPTDASSSNINGFIDFSASPDLYPEGRYARITWDDNNSAFRFFARDVDDGNPSVPIPFVVSIEGQVGIGSNAPHSKLHVVDGNITVDNSIIDDTGSLGGNTHINMMTHDMDGTRGLEVGSPNKGWAFFARGNNYTGSGGHQQNDFGLAFYDAGVWRNLLFIEHDTGNIGINTVSPQAMLDVRGGFRLGITYGETGTPTVGPVIETNGDNLILSPVKDTTGRVWIRDQNSPARIEFYSTSNSTIQAVNNLNAPANLTINPNGGSFLVGASAYKPGGGAWTATSDIRLKNVDGPYRAGLDEIVVLEPIRFHYKTGNARNEPTDRTFIGLSAQAVREVMPEMISERDDGYLDLDPSALPYALINAVKDLKAENDALRAELQAANHNFRRELDELKSVIGE